MKFQTDKTEKGLTHPFNRPQLGLNWVFQI